MHVVATAGHVDHGKSTLVRALTGGQPDRLAEERRRGLSIELGYCWTHLPGAGDIAFVDVPGHERFVPTMLAGVGPVPAVLFVVAADDPWMPQAAEHLAALHALGVRHGVLAVTRADLAVPGPARDRARAELAATSLADVPAVTVSGRSGEGLDELRAALVALVRRLPSADPGADVRLWIDRAFHVRGAGTVVTGTLVEGTIAPGDALVVGDRTVRVRTLQSLERDVSEVSGVARVAIGLGGGSFPGLERGGVLVTPDAWHFTDGVDVLVDGTAAARLPRHGQVHIGSTVMPARVRPLGGGVTRLRTDSALPLRIGDRLLLRDPASRRLWGATVLDPEPEALTRRGDAARRAATLSGAEDLRTLAVQVARHGVIQLSAVQRLGVDVSAAAEAGTVHGDWVISDAHARALGARLDELVTAHDRADPLEPGLPVVAAARELALPSTDLIETVVRPPLRLDGGRVVHTRGPRLAPEVVAAVERLRTELADATFAAPTAARLAELGLTPRVLAAAAKSGELLRLDGSVFLLPGADRRAVEILSTLPQPFTTSQARSALDTSRRVVLPLLQRLDALRLTDRLLDDRRTTRLR